MIFKNNKRVRRSACALLLTALLSPGVAFADTVPDSVVVNRAEVMQDIITNYDYGFMKFETDRGDTIFSITLQGEGEESGTVLYLTDDYDAGLQYILENGYPNKQITGNDEIDFTITQAVIWYYLDGDYVSNEFKNADKTDSYQLLPKYIEPMVAAAQEAAKDARNPIDTVTDAAFSVECDNYSMKLSDDGSFWESPWITVTTSDERSFRVSCGFSGARVEDELGYLHEELNSGTPFRVRVPADSLSSPTMIPVSVTTEGIVPRVHIYAPEDPSYDRMAYLVQEDAMLEKGLSFAVAPEDNSAFAPAVIATALFAVVVVASVVITAKRR